jgi:hypothetical protein
MKHISGKLRDSTLGEDTYATTERKGVEKILKNVDRFDSRAVDLWINRGGGRGGGVEYDGCE